jgi:hypothetical protein
MIYFTAFVLTLLLSHIARAMPTCGDVTSPEELYDPTYADAQSALPIVVYSVTWSSKYDNANGNTNNVSCSNGPHGLAPLYPHVRNFPGFPFIGGTFNIKWGSPNCGECWNLSYSTHLGTHKSILFTAIDTATTGFNISREAFIVLNGGKLGGGRLQAEAKLIPRHFCGFK